jgi:general secretion pathway protein D
VNYDFDAPAPPQPGRRRTVTIIAIAAWVLTSGLSEAAPVTLSVIPPATTVPAGHAVTLDLVVQDVTDLFAYQLDLTFDPAILRADGVTDGGFLTSAGGTSVFGGAFALAIDNTTGLVTILDSLLGPVPPALGASGGGVLASVTFAGLNAGTSPLGLLNLVLEDSTGNLLDAAVGSGQVKVTAVTGVPEPAPSLLVAIGLVLGLRRSMHP